MGTILLGNPANVVVSKVTQIAILEKKYKVIDWIDDMKSNQLGQLHTIWDVSKSLVKSNVLSTTTVNDIISNIVPKAVDMHERIVGEHTEYHNRATELRDRITTLVNEIKSIVEAASGIDTNNSEDVASVKRDQVQINSMRSKLLKIVQDNANVIDTSDDKPSVQYTEKLNKMDYNDIDQLANIDLTNKSEEEHMHVDNDDHRVTDEIYKFGASTYTITFKDGENVLKTVTDLTGTPIEVPTVSDKEGYVFDGWTIDGENIVLPVVKIGTEDITYTVVWKDAYTIKFKDGEDVIDMVVGLTGTTVTAPTVSDKEGYAAVGWTIDGENPVLPVTNIGTKDITYTVLWKVAYTITFKDGEEILHTVTGVTGTTVAAPAELEKEGYVFDGWTVDGVNKVLPVTNIGTENVTYTVVWNKLYTITFKDGEEILYTLTSVTGTTVTAPTQLEKEGYVFDGWTVDGENKVLPVAKIGTEDVTYTVVWKIAPKPTGEPAPVETEAPAVEP